MPVFLSVVLYALSAVYFAGVMVRLMLTLTPVVCILASIAISKTLTEYLADDSDGKKKDEEGEGEETEEDEEEVDRKNRKLYDKVRLEVIWGDKSSVHS